LFDGTVCGKPSCFVRFFIFEAVLFFFLRLAEVGGSGGLYIHRYLVVGKFKELSKFSQIVCDLTLGWNL